MAEYSVFISSTVLWLYWQKHHRCILRRPNDAKYQGWIKVKFLIDEHGKVGRIAVLNAEPRGVFEESVLRCISNWRFKPGTVNGVAVKAMVEQTITFKLEG